MVINTSMPDNQEQQPPRLADDPQVYLDSLRDQLGCVDTENGPDEAEHAFTKWFLHLLEETGEEAGGQECHLDVPRCGTACAYHLDADAGRMTLYTSIWIDGAEVHRLGIHAIRDAISGAVRLITCHRQKPGGKRHRSHGDDVEEFRGALSLTGESPTFRIVVVTNALVPRLPEDADPEIEGRPVEVTVWHLERLRRLQASGRQSLPVDADIVKDGKAEGPVRFLRSPPSDPTFDAYVGIMPVRVVAEIYKRFHARLLERNVRAFLSARGKVNRGIRETIAETPGMFLAYNNGLCVTASAIEADDAQDGTVLLRCIKDMQIVNGGQTAATLAAALGKLGPDKLSTAMVQVKLSVIRDSSRLLDIVSRISQYANTQNKVNDADLRSNDSFHVAMERHSRTIWAPGQKHRWFYERARGGYEDLLTRDRTLRKQLEVEYPKRLKVQKEEFAKSEMTWMQRPDIVAHGPVKAFNELTLRLADSGGTAPDDRFFRHSMARLILWRATDRILAGLVTGGMRSQYIAYTLGWMYHRTARGIDLVTVWQDQAPGQTMRELLTAIATAIVPRLREKGGEVVSEWFKDTACWESVRGSDLGLDAGKIALMDQWRRRGPPEGADPFEKTPAQVAAINKVVSLGVSHWTMLYAWVSKTEALTRDQRSKLSVVVAQMKRRHRPSAGHAVLALQSLATAEALGFGRTDDDLGQSSPSEIPPSERTEHDVPEPGPQPSRQSLPEGPDQKTAYEQTRQSHGSQEGTG